MCLEYTCRDQLDWTCYCQHAACFLNPGTSIRLTFKQNVNNLYEKSRKPKQISQILYATHIRVCSDYILFGIVLKMLKWRQGNKPPPTSFFPQS